MISLRLGDVVAGTELVGSFLRDRVDLAVEAVEPVDQLGELARRRDDRADVGAGDRADVVDREHVRRIRDRDDEPVLLPEDRQRLVLAGQVLGDEGRDRRVDADLGEIDELESDLGREGTDEIDLVDVAPFDQDAWKGLARLGLLGERGVELRPREQPLRDQECPELIPFGHAYGSSRTAAPMGLLARDIGAPGVGLKRSGVAERGEHAQEGTPVGGGLVVVVFLDCLIR